MYKKSSFFNKYWQIFNLNNGRFFRTHWNNIEGNNIEYSFFAQYYKRLSVYPKFDFILNKQPLNVVDGNG